MNKKILITTSIILILFALVSLTGCNTKLTECNFDKITCGELNQDTLEFEGGMTLEEIIQILGKPSNNSSLIISGAEIKAYIWGTDKKRIIISFYNKIAIMKIQVGIF